MKDLEYTTLVPSECGNYWETPDGKRHRPLTPKHKKFCRLYMQGLSAAKAARQAGFTTNMISSKVQGSAMIRKNPLVVNHIIELMTKERNRSDVSMGSHLTELSHLRDQAIDSGQLPAAISAEVSRGRAAGLYIERKEVTVSKIETLSNEELFTRLQDIVEKSNIKMVENEERERHVPSIEEKSSEGALAKN
mgnify:CR=1 FL=1